MRRVMNWLEPTGWSFWISWVVFIAAARVALNVQDGGITARLLIATTVSYMAAALCSTCLRRWRRRRASQTLT